MSQHIHQNADIASAMNQGSPPSYVHCSSARYKVANSFRGFQSWSQAVFDLPNQHSPVPHPSLFQSINGILDSFLCHGERYDCWLDIMSGSKSEQVNNCLARSSEGSLDGSSQITQAAQVNGGVLFRDSQGVDCATDGQELNQAAAF